MHIGPGSDGSSADKLSIDLKVNPCYTTITFRPEWRSLSKTVFTQYDPSERWYTCQSNVWLNDVKRFYPRPMRCVIAVHLYPLEPEDSVLSKQHAFLSGAKRCVDDSRFSPRLAQRQVRDVEQETEERNIRQHSIHHRDPSDHVEFTDQHYPARSNDHENGDSSD